MEKKNIHVTKDGMKVGVKEVKTEDYEDKTQKYEISCPNHPRLFSGFLGQLANMCYSVLVKAWNHASFPGYKSRIWNTDATPGFKKNGSSTSARPSASRSSSSTSKVKTAS